MTADMPSDWKEHAYPGLPEVRLLRAIYGLCPECDHPNEAHRGEGEDYYISHNCSLCPERASKAGYELVCVCGNEPAYDGFESCLEDGTVVEPTGGGGSRAWKGKLYLCLKCGRIVDQDSLLITGKSRLGGDSDAW